MNELLDKENFDYKDYKELKELIKDMENEWRALRQKYSQNKDNY